MQGKNLACDILEKLKERHQLNMETADDMQFTGTKSCVGADWRGHSHTYHTHTCTHTLITHTLSSHTQLNMEPFAMEKTNKPHLHI